jgi:hypothetical protein
MRTTVRVCGGRSPLSLATMRSKRVLLASGAVVASTLLAYGAYRFLFVNDGIYYYSSDPRGLVYPILAAAVIGILLFGISRLPRTVSRPVRLIALGTIGIIFAGGIAWGAYVLNTYGNITGDITHTVFAFGGALLASAIVWWEFLRAVKAR